MSPETSSTAASSALSRNLSSSVSVDSASWAVLSSCSFGTILPIACSGLEVSISTLISSPTSPPGT